MAKFVLYTDSGSDMPQEMADELGIKDVPLSSIIHGTAYSHYLNFRNFDQKKFYSEIRSGTVISTSAVNVGDFIDNFEDDLKAGNDILYISLSSGISATYQNSINAINELKESYPERKIISVDSLGASMGQSLLVYLCAQKMKEGASIEEVAEYAEKTRLFISHEFTVDDLNFLKRGGRVSAVTAFVGTLLKIKPVLHVSNDGKLIPIGKAKGRRASLAALVSAIAKSAVDKDETPIFVSHGDCMDDVDIVIEMIKEKMPDKKVFVGLIGPVIGAHSGPGTMAVFCLGSGRENA